MEQDSFEAFLKALRTDQDRLREDMRPYESGGYLLLRRAPTGELQDVTDQYVAKIKRDIDSIDGAIEFVMAQQGPRHLQRDEASAVTVGRCYKADQSTTAS